jgi:transcriptional regulator with XRE-family HTH domain
MWRSHEIAILEEDNPMTERFTAQQLIDWRKGHGWTQAEAATRILLSLDGYRKKEQGVSSVNKRDMKLIKLADQEAAKEATA